PDVGRDYDKRVVMVPMRDGTKLYTGDRGAQGRPQRADPDVGRDYDKRVVMVPMRDGTKLYTGDRGAQGRP
ncbi:hypothetical protein C7E25_25120, partial [Stenotrophomonas maltophilia]